MTQKEINAEKRRIVLLLDKLMNAPSACYNPQCPTSRPAINSHILQQNGILSHITDKASGHIMEYASETPFQERHFSRKSVSTSDVMAFVGFCELCDKKIFQEIEDSEPDFTNYRQLMLFTYRAYLSSYHKARVCFELYKTVVADKSFSEYYRNYCLKEVKSYALQARFNDYYKNKFEEFIFNSIEVPIGFKVFELPKVEIAGAFGFAPTAFIEESIAEEIRSTGNEALIKAIGVERQFVNIIPMKNKLIFVYGYMNDLLLDSTYGSFIKSLDIMPEIFIFKVISDILIRYSDSWAMSIKLYDKLKKLNRTDLLIKQIRYFTNASKRNEAILFNLFEGLI